MDTDDHHFRQLLAARDRSAVVALYDRYGDLCYRAALASCAVPALAEDAVQEVFMRIITNPAQLAAARNLVGYLLRMAQNSACDLHRRAAHRHRCLDEAVAAAEGHEDGERTVRVAAAMAALPHDQRSVVQLRVWEGRSLAEAGEILGISVNTVSSRWRYALEKLTHLLQDCHDS